MLAIHPPSLQGVAAFLLVEGPALVLMEPSLQSELRPSAKPWAPSVGT